MPYLRPKRRLQAFAAGLAALVFLGTGLVAQVSAQTADPVEKIRVALKLNPFPDPTTNEFREKDLDRAIAGLHTPAELRRALELSEWTDNESLGSADQQRQSAVDRAARKKIADKLTAWLTDAVDHGDVTSQLAAATFVGEIGATIRALTTDFELFGDISVHRDPNGLGRSLAPLMVKLIEKKGERAVRQQAARALGKINPDPKVAAPALRGLLSSKIPGDRLAAAEALATLVTNTLNLQKAGRVQSGVIVGRDNVIEAATEVVPVAATHASVAEPDPMVRRQCLKALVQSAVAFNEMIPDPREVNKLLQRPRESLSEIDKTTIREFQEVVRVADRLFPPLIAALQKQGKVLAAALEDPDDENRIQARRALEAIARLRLSLIGLPGAARASAKAPDPLMDALTPSLKVFGQRLFDPDVNVRRASLDFLEQMESAIGPAIPAIQAALEDPDRFIRWAAARSLRDIGEKNIEATAAESVPLLAKLLGPDEDPDVRESAATTLRHYGTLARPALPALIAAVEYGELEQRDALIKAIQHIAGPKELPQAMPALRKALTSKSINVRKAAADALGSMGPAATPAIDDLRLRLQDDDPTVRAAASDALLLITRPKQ
jgi:HEAT repeat protein